jgi:hypothetical protein
MYKAKDELDKYLFIHTNVSQEDLETFKRKKSSTDKSCSGIIVEDRRPQNQQGDQSTSTVNTIADKQLCQALQEAMYPEGKIQALFKKFPTTCPLHPDSDHDLFNCNYFTKLCRDINTHQSLFNIKVQI